MSKKCYFNGEIINFDEVRISPYDLGFLRGYGVFDVMRTVNGGKLFLFQEHWNRLVSSAEKLHLQVPVSKNELKDVMEKLVDIDDEDDCVIRTIITGGVSKNAFSVTGDPTLLVITENLEKMSPSREVYSGAKVITVDFKRSIPTAKISNYVEPIRHQEKKMKAGAIEIVYTHKGQALEASTSNFFIIKDGKVITTKDDILLGTTRNLIVDLARKNGFEVEEREVSIDEMFGADEMFLTAANKNIVPVVQVDEKKIGGGKVGETTKKLMKILSDYMISY
jgi:D-amino acid aminotransferase